MHLGWKNLSKYDDRNAWDALGFLPQIIRQYGGKLKDQIAHNYAHGGGYSPFGQGKWVFDKTSKHLKYPGDPAYQPIAELAVGDELFIFYPHAVCAIVQKDGSFDVIRMD